MTGGPHPSNGRLRQRWGGLSRKGKVGVVVGATVLSLVGLGSLPKSGADNTEPTAPPLSEVATSDAPLTEAPGTRAPTTMASTTVTPTTTAPVTAPPETPAPQLTVTHVVDGDTLDVSSGERIRLIGMDTPEVGACGYQEAADALAAMVQDKAVTLVAVPGRDDQDRYGRLLRYVQVDGKDAGLALIQAGLSIARYDSRDGYGGHPQEAGYIAADAATPASAGCSVPTTAVPPVQPLMPPVAPGGGTDQRFPTCKTAIAAGLGPYVAGVDPEYDWYRDGDSDGTVCER